MIVRIAECRDSDLENWAIMRAALWPEATITAHHIDLQDTLAGSKPFTGFIARSEEGVCVGFAEAALRTDWVNGCKTSPVAFLEGLYVTEAFRRQGLGRGLVTAVEGWARSQGCLEIASDALLDNVASHAMHGALNFEETERVVYFRKVLDSAILPS